ncbi:MAG: 5'-nucleotidase, lipoprotein e(P4) family [Planctomycetota bacterium]
MKQSRTGSSRHAALVTVSLALLFAGTACETSPDAASATQTGLDAVLWTQRSAERAALCEQAFAAATAQLDAAALEPGWSAGGSVGGSASMGSRRPAVVLDVDETVLDNSPYQAWVIRNGTTFSPATWDAWCLKGEAEALPGSAAFLRAARARGLDVFYVTNRDATLKDATFENLKRELDPAVTMDKLLCRGERGWTGDKESRRVHVSRTHRIVMFFGDDLGDFLSPAYASPEERMATIAEHRSKWGTRWFVLPNPMYGSWERTIAEGDGEARVKSKVAALRPQE